MKFSKPLLVGTLLQRYKRFFADVEYKGEKITIHVPNTGSLKGVIDKNLKQQCWFSLHGDTSKKLKGTLEAIQAANGTWVGMNTSNPNKIVQEAILNLKTAVDASPPGVRISPPPPLKRQEKLEEAALRLDVTQLRCGLGSRRC